MHQTCSTKVLFENSLLSIQFGSFLKMYVVKRDGRQETLHFNKIVARFKKLKDVTTSQLDELVAEIAAAMIGNHPDYAPMLQSSIWKQLADARKQYDLMLESKQLELSRHLKELSQKNDQAINDIRRRFEVEKLEGVNIEKEKADKAVQEMESKCDQKLAECKGESRQYLMRIQEEHATLEKQVKAYMGRSLPSISLWITWVS